MDMFQDLFGNSDSEEEFLRFELTYNEVEDGADIDERDEGEPIRRFRQKILNGLEKQVLSARQISLHSLA